MPSGSKISLTPVNSSNAADRMVLVPGLIFTVVETVFGIPEGIPISPGTVRFLTLVQPEKALDPTETTVLGNVMLERLLQRLKAFDPILTSDLENLTSVRLLQPSNADAPISRTESFNETVLRFIAFLKAFAFKDEAPLLGAISAFSTP